MYPNLTDLKLFIDRVRKNVLIEFVDTRFLVHSFREILTYNILAKHNFVIVFVTLKLVRVTVLNIFMLIVV